MTSKIEIVISGSTNVGKTTVRAIIVEALSDLGINVSYTDESVRYDSMERRIDSLIANDLTINITETLTPKGSYHGTEREKQKDN